MPGTDRINAKRNRVHRRTNLNSIIRTPYRVTLESFTRPPEFNPTSTLPPNSRCSHSYEGIHHPISAEDSQYQQMQAGANLVLERQSFSHVVEPCDLHIKVQAEYPALSSNPPPLGQYFIRFLAILPPRRFSNPSNLRDSTNRLFVVVRSSQDIEKGRVP